jgi:hypothetical protein
LNFIALALLLQPLVKLLQPFLRPIKQFALAVNLGVEAKRIYDHFKGGDLLFPKEPITDFINKAGPKFTT